mmetsp:Transcript_12839/g.30485  ORF Transcript_12839/g.30485 Transcript_12839/m.30485 type:complete len:149 (-) Transcript_12839:124-570(-)
MWCWAHLLSSMKQDDGVVDYKADDYTDQWYGVGNPTQDASCTQGFRFALISSNQPTANAHCHFPKAGQDTLHNSKGKRIHNGYNVHPRLNLSGNVSIGKAISRRKKEVSPKHSLINHGSMRDLVDKANNVASGFVADAQHPKTRFLWT